MTESKGQTAEKVALTNVRVFDGDGFGEPSTVVIESDGLIGTDATGARIVDGGGDYLLPGFIDSHIHLHGRESLEAMGRYGITTALDMATWPASVHLALRGLPGLPDVRSAGKSASARGSIHSRAPQYPEDSLVENPEEARRFVETQLAEGSDYIKIVADVPGPTQEVMNALVAAAHEHGKLAIAHAVSYEPARMAQEAGVDMLTHIPLNRPFDDEAVQWMVRDGRVLTPTLIMMKGTVETLTKRGIPGLDFANGLKGVAAAYAAGVPILVGTDANAEPFPPASPPHGESLHDEFALLVEAGVSPLDAVRGATSLAAKHFRLSDRGAIRPGLRADLVLLGDDPTVDISATRLIKRVWGRGIEFARS